MKHGNSQTGKLPVFRERLRSLQGDLTTTAFAEKLGLSRQTTGFYINGDRIPDIQTLQQICERCNVSADWLLGISEISSPNSSVQNTCAHTGLSETAVMRLAGRDKPENAFIDFLLCSDKFFELDFTFSNFLDHIKWYNSCIRGVLQCEDQAASLDRSSAEYIELDKQWNNYMNSAQRWATEQEVNIYRMSMIFGNMLDQYRKEKVIIYGSHRED